jgi:hypothetical protein
MVKATNGTVHHVDLAAIGFFSFFLCSVKFVVSAMLCYLGIIVSVEHCSGNVVSTLRGF